MGSETLNTQHLGMFDIINKLYSEMQHGLHPEQLYIILQELRRYAEIHFYDEIQKFETHEELSSWIKRIVNKIYKYLIKEKKHVYSRAVFKAIKYIKDNYNKSTISLTEVSNFVN